MTQEEIAAQEAAKVEAEKKATEADAKDKADKEAAEKAAAKKDKDDVPTLYRDMDARVRALEQEKQKQAAAGNPPTSIAARVKAWLES